MVALTCVPAGLYFTAPCARLKESALSNIQRYSPGGYITWDAREAAHWLALDARDDNMKAEDVLAETWTLTY
jgi:hypothetical protein